MLVLVAIGIHVVTGRIPTPRPSVVAPPAITEPIRLDPPGAESSDGPRLPRRGSFPVRERIADRLGLCGLSTGFPAYPQRRVWPGAAGTLAAIVGFSTAPPALE